MTDTGTPKYSLINSLLPSLKSTKSIQPSSYYNMVKIKIIMYTKTICNRILGNDSISHMKYSVFLHVFIVMSTYSQVFLTIFQ